MTRHNPIALLACTLLALILFCAVVGRSLASYDPLQSNAAAALQPPSSVHWFGTDQLGRDQFSRVLAAARLDLMLAFSAVLLSAALGTAIGAIIGYRGGLLDGVTSRLVDVLMAFPLFVLALAVVAALGNSIASVVYATVLINLPFYIRLARAEIRARRNLAYVEAARIGGGSDRGADRRIRLGQDGARAWGHGHPVPCRPDYRRQGAV